MDVQYRADASRQLPAVRRNAQSDVPCGSAANRKKRRKAHWIRADTGAIADGGLFAHLLSEAFLALYQTDHDSHWRDVTQKALQFVHASVHDASGYYGDQWGKPSDHPLREAKLIQQASAARAFLVYANGGP